MSTHHFSRRTFLRGVGVTMALPWLDAARYADTNGFADDQRREIWPYRDWVIEAMRRNIGSPTASSTRGASCASGSI